MPGWGCIHVKVCDVWVCDTLKRRTRIIHAHTKPQTNKNSTAKSKAKSVWSTTEKCKKCNRNVLQNRKKASIVCSFAHSSVPLAQMTHVSNTKLIFGPLSIYEFLFHFKPRLLRTAKFIENRSISDSTINGRTAMFL